MTEIKDETPATTEPTEQETKKLKLTQTKTLALANTRAKIQTGFRLIIALDGNEEFNDIIPFSLNRICKNLENSGNVPPGLGYKLRKYLFVTVEYPSGQKRTFSLEKV